MADHPHNLVRNGSFEHWYSEYLIPYYWSKTGNPTVVKETSNLDRNNFDNLCAVKITTAAANEGIEVTLSNLKASTTYRVQCRAKTYQASDDAVLDVEGESGTFTPQETNNPGWTDLAGTFATDGTPTDITIKLLGKASGDIVWFDNVIVTEGSTAYAFAPHPLDNEIVALLSKDLHPNNLVRNGSFEMWSGASGDPPDGWTKFGGSVDEETFHKKLGNRSAKITGDVSPGQLRYEFSNGAEFAGHKVTVRAWVRAGEAGIAKVGIHDVGQSLSDGNTKINTWELLTFTTTVSSGCTTLKVILHVDSTKIGYFDGVMFVDSEIPFLFTPHPLDIGGEVYGDLTFKGGKKVKGLPAASANGEAVRYEQAELVARKDAIDGYAGLGLGAGYSYVGNDPIDRVSGQPPGVTILLRDNTITSKGRLISAEIFFGNPTYDAKVKIFRDGGTTWDFVGETNTFTRSAAGYEEIIFTTTVNVEVGDYIALYIPSGAIDRADTGGSTSLISGDCTSNQNKAAWDDYAYIISLKGKIAGISLSLADILTNMPAGAGQLPIANMEQRVSILTGTIATGNTIPLPGGYTPAQCKWTIGSVYYARYAAWYLTQNVYPSVDAERLVTVSVGQKHHPSGDVKNAANITVTYIIIGVK